MPANATTYTDQRKYVQDVLAGLLARGWIRSPNNLALEITTPLMRRDDPTWNRFTRAGGGQAWLETDSDRPSVKSAVQRLHSVLRHCIPDDLDMKPGLWVLGEPTFTAHNFDLVGISCGRYVLEGFDA